MTKAKPTSEVRLGKSRAANKAQSDHYTQLLCEYMKELETCIAEGCQVIPHRDGSETRISYQEMDPDAKLMFLGVAVDFTAYVNRGMEPAHGNRIIDNILAGKERSRWLEGILGEDQTLPRQ
ncbi:MAG TPA: hypothetical protein VJ739_18820 [Gemmataceae bacterium]|nr:hypothetical protein [Gemmataceae bacterium]